MSRRDLDALLAYLAENGGRYPREALRAQILKAGHPAPDADRALAVFEGRMAPPAPPLWPAVLFVALFDFALAALCVLLFQSQGAGRLSCSALVLVPAAYLAELAGGLIALAANKERLGRSLLLGVLLFFALALLVLLVILARWMGRTAGS
jgi:hypothetical protein